MDAVIPIVFLGSIVGLAVLILLANDKISGVIWRLRNPPEKLAEQRRAFHQRLLNPDWEFYKAHLMRPVPPSLVELFADQALLIEGDTLRVGEIYITSFEPLDSKGLADTQSWVGVGTVPFARSDGDPIYLRPGAAETNAVYITFHDGGDTEELCADISQFIQALKTSASAA